MREEIVDIQVQLLVTCTHVMVVNSDYSRKYKFRHYVLCIQYFFIYIVWPSINLMEEGGGILSCSRSYTIGFLFSQNT